KTSLVMKMLSGLSRKSFLSAYVDLWPTDDASSFVGALAKSLSEAGASRAEKAFETAKSLFSNLKPALTLDQSGNPSLQFGATPYAIPEPDLREALEAAQSIASKRNRKVVVVLDEFQRVAEYDDDTVERTLRSVIQSHKDVAYLFLGSRKHLIRSMFLDTGRPLYRSATHYPLQPIESKHWIGFILSRFEREGRSIPIPVVERLCVLTDGHPFYTQYLAHALWELTPAGEMADDARLDAALDLLLERESYAYMVLWDSLTMNQLRLLRGFALAGDDLAPFSGEFARTFGLSTPANTQSAAKGLLARDIIDREEGSFVIIDRFLKLWVKRTFGP
ncbi:MAG TPA: hypothetical protein VMO47_18865, partial [Rhodothermales bacterium]|nr:hypothetical protein [Rhodothermales bacterium]